MHEDARIVVMNALRAAGFTGWIAVRSHDLQDARELPGRGAQVVLEPFVDAAVRAVELIDMSGAASADSSRRTAPAVSDSTARS